MPDVDAFVARWSASSGSERSNSQLFLGELCDLLEVPRPEPFVAGGANTYVFERGVRFSNGDGTFSDGRIDLYRQGCFVLESKQGVLRREAERGSGRVRTGSAVRATQGWDQAMTRACEQAQRYLHALPADEGRPPFVLTCDVGHSFELYAEFSRTGGDYTPFPAAPAHRLFLADLARPETRDLLRSIWLTPLDLDPSRRTARVTREIADRLARLATSLEAAGHLPETVAAFLMRCLFTMFAEDVGLLPGRSFTELLDSLRATPDAFKPMAEEVWRTMKHGGFSAALRAPLRHFNGALFAEAEALGLSAEQLDLLLEASRADWREVEPAIFGTLLERALSPRERHKLGAHYTPRAYVERLVIPTVVEPLRADWEAARIAARKLDSGGETAKAIAELRTFHSRLCQVRVLDPACGSGNFLYVTLEHLKRLEGEVLDALRGLGYAQEGLEHAEGTVGPRQLLGLEINPRAAAIAELVLWIGYLQWHLKTRGLGHTPEPVIGDFHNVECRDAVLAYDGVPQMVLGEDGRPVMRWDGHSTKPHAVTGEPVPDETKTVPVYRYVNPRPVEWPEAEFVVGNPPFIGISRMRAALGDGYVESLRAAHPKVPDSADYVMYWWDHAAELARAGKLDRFGLITTNSIWQTYSRRVLQRHLGGEAPVSIAFAVPDHPWVDAADGADVRIAMTVGRAGEGDGTLVRVTAEDTGAEGVVRVELAGCTGRLQADLTIGAAVWESVALKSNDGLAHRGVQLMGAGFIVTPEQATALGLGRVPGLEHHIRPYLNGRDVSASPRGAMVVDLFGLGEEEVRRRFPEVYQRVLERVKPARDQNNRLSYRQNWWVYGEPRTDLRAALDGLHRFISTIETSRRRYFVLLDAAILPDNKLVNVALEDAYYLGVLSSRIHVTWALAAGSRLGVGNDPVYVKSRCFDPFPFPAATESLQQRIRDLGEQLDAHRKRQQALHSDLTLTDMYNVLEKLRAGTPLSAKDRVIHEHGLVSVLKQIHDDLDRAVFAAYGWDPGLSDEELLEKLVALNAERAAEEQRGLIRWLRPDYQNPGGQATQLRIETGDEVTPEPAATARRPWPARLSEQVAAVRAALAAMAAPATAEQVARGFERRATRQFTEQVAEVLRLLEQEGQARAVEGGRYVGR